MVRMGEKGRGTGGGWEKERVLSRRMGAGAADSGGQEGQPPLLEKSRRGKTIFLTLLLADLTRRLLANWSLQIENWVFFTAFFKT